MKWKQKIVSQTLKALAVNSLLRAEKDNERNAGEQRVLYEYQV
jgi:hypothetical protein